MDKHRHVGRNLIQNLAIILLSVSAALLFIWTYALSSKAGSSYLSNLLSPGIIAGETAAAPTRLTELPAPVILAVTGKYGRSGNISLCTTDQEFAAPGSLLREALGSAGTPAACTEKDFRAALNLTSVYCDFRTSLPLSLLGSLLGADDAPAAGSARRLLLSAGEDGARLYLTDGETYSCCTTRVTSSALSKLAGSYQLGSASFAFELEGGADLAPYSLLLTGAQPTLPALSAASAFSDSSASLTALGFNPHTKSRYTEIDGTDLIRDGDRTLRLRPDGRLLYDSGGDDAVQLSAAGETLTAEEAALGSYRLLTGLLSGGDSGPTLALCGMEQHGDARTLLFDYQLDGIPIRRSDGTPAARITLTGAVVSSLSLQVRQYSPTGGESLLLPLTQALAIANRHAGAELEICYTDSGSSGVSAGWLAD